MPASITENTINEKWRSLFVGEKHTAISNNIAHSFMAILQAAEENNLIKQSDYVRNRISQVDINDISDTAKLITMRFEARFKNRRGVEFQANLPSLIQTFCYSPEAANISSETAKKLKASVYRGIQLEAICKQLSYSRNLNAHSQDVLSDMGHGILVSGAVLRLWELFDYEVPERVLIDIRETCFGLLKSCWSLASDLSPQEVNIPESYNNFDAENDEDTNHTNVEDHDDQSESLPIEYLPDNNNQELKRQKLMTLRLEILNYMRDNFADLRRNKCILSTQIITEILALKITSLTEFNRSPSLSYLLDTNEDAVKAQLGEFGESIIEILDQFDE